MTRFLLCIFLSVFTFSAQAGHKFELYSTAFKSGAFIPSVYTCEGTNVSPALQWTGVPKKAKSLSLIVTDYDAVKSVGFPVKHWVVYNIPAKITAFSTGTASVITGLNSRNAQGYTGPCPPRGQQHEYHFDLYALDTADLNLNKMPPTADELIAAMHGHVIAEASLVGKFQRQQHNHAE